MTEEYCVSQAVKFPYCPAIYSGICTHCGEIAFTYCFPKGEEFFCGVPCHTRFQQRLRRDDKKWSEAGRGGHPLGRGEFAANWRGGYSINRSGYRVVFSDDIAHAGKIGGILEHRLVMGRMVGRPLKRFESVHHKNGIRTDNRPENLELWSSRPQHSGQRVDDLIDFALTHYEKEVRSKLEIKDLVRAVIARVSGEAVK